MREKSRRDSAPAVAIFIFLSMMSQGVSIVKTRLFRHTFGAILGVVLLFYFSSAFAENIDPTGGGYQYAWGENVGWVNLEPSGDGGPGADVGDSAVTGYLWSENIGWISLSCANTNSCGTVSYGVTNDGNGNLSGYAWSENVGWISFSCENTNSCATATYGITIDPAIGEFNGYAWAENIGWINFAPAGSGANTSWRSDTDGDAVLNNQDNCPDAPNPGQEDYDGDGQGDACDADDDGDGLSDADEAAIGTSPLNPDTDNDGITDILDNCPVGANPDQTDTDGDGQGDVCDTDDDGDTLLDATDNCPLVTNSDQSDLDGDGIGDVCDICPICGPGFAEDIDPAGDGSQYAWGENVGWVNLEPSGDGGPGADVGDSAVTGYLWGENIGWISLSCGNTESCGTVSYGVTNNGNGNLSGYAWSENVGWISFSCENTNSCATADYGVAIDPTTGEFSGYAWAENIGWINFAPPAGGANTSWIGATNAGDVNEDGIIDIIDAILILRIVIGLDPFNGLADFDGDGFITVSDVIISMCVANGNDAAQCTSQ